MRGLVPLQQIEAGALDREAAKIMPNRHVWMHLPLLGIAFKKHTGDLW